MSLTLSTKWRKEDKTLKRLNQGADYLADQHKLCTQVDSTMNLIS